MGQGICGAATSAEGGVLEVVVANVDKTANAEEAGNTLSCKRRPGSDFVVRGL